MSDVDGDLDVDIAVVGAGLAGAAAAWTAAREGLAVALVEQFEVGHALGSSHGSARIYRRAYADPLYIRLTGEAGELWREVERDSGQELLSVTGGLDHGAQREPHRLAALLAEAGAPHELLDATEAGRRWPGMVFDSPVLVHPEAGVIDADAAIETFVAGARDRGASVLEHTRVDEVTVTGGRAELIAGGRRIRADRVIVAAGAWLGPLVGDLLALPRLTVTQQQVFHFAYRDPATSWPTQVRKDDVDVYGLPSGRDTAPVATYKIGEHAGGAITSAARRDGQVDPASRARVVDHVRRRLPGLVPEPIAEASCLYTSTESTDFVLDRVGPLVVCSACSGHGAKFAPLLGRIAVDLALGKPAPDARFALRPAA